MKDLLLHHNQHLITCNHNTTIQNISIEMNVMDNDDKFLSIAIYSQNKNNITLKNIIIKNEENMSSNRNIGIFFHGGEGHHIDNINIWLDMGFDLCHLVQ